MLPHIHTWNFRSGKNQNSVESNFYDKTLVLSIQNERRAFDGLNSLRYVADRVVVKQGYTEVLIELKRIEVDRVNFILSDKVLTFDQFGTEVCHYTTIYDAYIHPNFMPHETALLKQETGIEYLKLADFQVQKQLCDFMGPTCVAIVQETEDLYSLRESYQLVSHQTITQIFPTLDDLSVAHPRVELKQCSGVPGFPFYLGEVNFQSQFNFTVNFEVRMFMFPEAELWLAYHLFYENLDTGLIRDRNKAVVKFTWNSHWLYLIKPTNFRRPI